jgi:hypothetical protein
MLVGRLARTSAIHLFWFTVVSVGPRTDIGA